MDMHAQEAVQICEGTQQARGVAWSADGCYAYISCGTDESDVLLRYDTVSKNLHRMTDHESIKFRAVRLYPSQDGSYLLFVWAREGFSFDEAFGLWLLDFRQANGE